MYSQIPVEIRQSPIDTVLEQTYYNYRSWYLPHPSMAIMIQTSFVLFKWCSFMIPLNLEGFRMLQYIGGVRQERTF